MPQGGRWRAVLEELVPGAVGRMIETVPGVSEAVVRLVWDPPWGQERMTEEARLELGLL